MSSTAKAQLQASQDFLDSIFAKVHPSDRAEVVKELRGYLNRQNSAVNRPAYDKHSNIATSTAN